MKVTFETEYGLIDIIRFDDGTMQAYFHLDDYATDIAKSGDFKDWVGRDFRVLWPIRGMKSNDVILEVRTWSNIGRVDVSTHVD